MCIFSPALSNNVYEWVEWMWRMSKRSGCGQYHIWIGLFLFALFFYFLEIRSYVFLFCIDDNVES